MSHAIGGASQNPYPDYFGELYMEKNGKIVAEFSKHLHNECKFLLAELYKLLGGDTSVTDNSVFSGLAGLALLHYLLFERLDNRANDRFLRQAVSFLDQPLAQLNKGETTFLTGDGGALAVAAVVYHHLGDEDKSEECVKCFLGYYSGMCSEKESDDLIFGRVGYLYSMLYLQQELGPDTVDMEFVRILYRKIVLHGQKTSKRHAWMNSPLLWEWHGKVYLGAAHGVAGVLHVLMQVSDASCQTLLDQFVRPTVDMMLALRNYPSAAVAGQQTQQLVSWCNGAPGWIYMFVMAHKIFGDKKYLKEAENCADTTWQRGLLSQAHCLCHGITGNAYSFLVLFRHSGNVKYLYRACKFAEACFDRKKFAPEINTNYMSLFEGITGTIYFMVDLLEPKKTRFPGFDL